MIEREYLIVGAGTAGIAACEGIRMHDKKGGILLAGNETYLPYGRPALSKAFLSKSSAKPDELTHQPSEWFAKHKIDLRLGTVITQFNLERHLAVLANGQTVHFEKAILATGSRATRPAVAGADLGNIIYLRSLNDALALREMGPLEEEVTVVGGGLLAAEVTASLAVAKRHVTMLNRDGCLWQQLVDPETASFLTEYFKARGVSMRMRDDLSGFEGKTVVKNIQTKNGGRHSATLIVCAIGSEMNLGLVRNTPLATPKGSPVSEYLETEEKGIYSVGDIALYPDKIFGGVRRETHHDHAHQSGLVAGQNVTGKKRIKYEWLPRWGSRLFDLDLEFIGDFSQPPVRIEVLGARDKKSFIIKHLAGEKVRAALLCNRKPPEAEALAKQIRADYGGK